MKLRPLVGGSIVVDDIRAFRVECKRRNFRVEGNFRARGNIINAFDANGFLVGTMVNYGSAEGLISPNHDVFKIDYIDDARRLQEVMPRERDALEETIVERKKSLGI